MGYTANKATRGSELPDAQEGEMPETNPDETPVPSSTSAQVAATEDEFEPKRAMHTIKVQREEVKTLKARLAEMEAVKAKLNEYEAAQLTETEKTRLELATLKERLAEQEKQRTLAETRAAELLKRAKFEVAASQAGALNAEHAYKLADLADIEVDADTGEVTGIEKAIKALQKSAPYLFKPPDPQLERFNPGNDAQGVRKTDAQVLDEVTRQMGVTHGPFGARVR